MGLLNDNFERKSSAFLLPDKIIVVAVYKKNEGTWYTSELLTILPFDVSNLELGEIILDITGQSKHEDIPYEKIKEYWKTLIKKSKYRSEKAFIGDAKYLSIIVEGDKISFVPFKSSASRRIFLRIPAAITEISPVPEAALVGKEIRESWGKCLFID